jgi:hypothetical protein
VLSLFAGINFISCLYSFDVANKRAPNSLFMAYRTVSRYPKPSSLSNLTIQVLVLRDSIVWSQEVSRGHENPVLATSFDTAIFLLAGHSSSTTLPSERQPPQTLTEKIVQRYAIGLPQGKVVRSGDYISISPERCMTHG